MPTRPRRLRPADLSLRVKGLALIILPVVVLAVAVGASVRVTDDENAFQASARDAVATSDHAGQVLVALLDAETGVRGYVASGNVRFLAPWRTAQRTLGDELRSLTASSLVTPAGRTDLLGPATTEMRVLGRLVRAGAPPGGHPTPEVRRGLLEGKALMDRLRVTVSAIQATAQRELVLRRAHVQSLRSTALAIAVAGLGVGLIAVLGMYLFIRRIVQRIESVRLNAYRLGIGEGLIAMPASGDELGRLSAELSQASELLGSRSADLVRAQRTALALSRDKDRFLSHLGHEMRTPLTAIAGFGELLEGSDALTPEDAESAALIVRATSHLIAITNDLESDGASGDALTLDVTPTRIDELAEAVRRLMTPIAAERAVDLRIDRAEPLVVLADHQRLSQVLINLVSNAVKYNRDGGRVEIRAAPAATGLARVAVSDTGIGIRAEMQPRVFAPYERIGAEAGPVEGSGIGLALSRTYIEAMGGSIGLESIEGEGATFWVELPMAEPGPEGETGR